MATTTAYRGKTRKPAVSRDERHARVQDLAEQLATYTKSLDPADQEAYEARFDMYSPRNSLLIVMQNPTATVVHGFHDWKNHGRRVAKGQSGIRIFAPAGAFTVEDRNAPAGPDGQPGQKAIQRFKVTYVWDISQTEQLDTPTGNGPAAG
jgi:hypothetical protein